jgi:adenosylhomocysteinase
MMDWVYENMHLVKIACKEVGKDLEGCVVSMAFPLEYKTAVLANELSKYCDVLVTPFSSGTTRVEAVEWLRDRGVEVCDVKSALKADYYLDCASTLVRSAKDLRDVKGIIELTKSGEEFLKTVNVRKAIVVDNSVVKGIGENVYGTGVGLLDGLLRLNLNVVGKTVAIVGFGRVGRGCAHILRNFCRVVVVEIDPIKAMEADYMGYEVVDLHEALKIADIVVTCTGRRKLLSLPEFECVKNGCVLCNMGAYNDEIDIESLKDWKVRDFGFVKRFERDEKYFYVVADGEAINLALGNGTPIEIMDRTFATVVYALHYTVINDFSGVIPLPKEIDEKIGELILGHRT